MIHRQPLTHHIHTPKPQGDTYYQWRGWDEDVSAILPKLRRRFSKSDECMRDDLFIIVPGRAEKKIVIDAKQSLRIQSRILEENGIEEWAEMVHAQLPLSRPTVTSISRRIPRLGVSLAMAETAEDVAESLSRRARAITLKREQKIYSRDEVEAHISKVKIGNRRRTSLLIRSSNPEHLRQTLSRFKLRPSRNKNLVETLMRA